MSAQILSQRWFHLSRFIASAFSSASLKDCYDSTAAYYEKIFGENQEYYAGLIVELLQDRFGGHFPHALDLGAGTGILTRKLGAISDSVCGIDFSFGMLKQAKAQRDAGFSDYIAGNILSLPFADRQFELITALGVMTHVLPQDFSRFIGELDRVAAPSAAVVVAMTPLPWRLFFGKRESFQTTAADRALIACYNLLQKTLRLDERRGVFGPSRFRDEFGKYGYCVEHHSVQNLAIVLAYKHAA